MSRNILDRDGFAMAATSRLRAIFAAVLLVSVAVLTAPQALAGTYTVSGVPVDVTAADASAARDQAIVDVAERLGDAFVYVISTSGGAAGEGQVFALDPAARTFTRVYASPGADVLDNPDNITVSPRGGLVLCEDGDNEVQALHGLTPIFRFAENRVVLNGQRNGIVGTFTSFEWAGATFEPVMMTSRAGLRTVVLAIVIPEVPRVVRLVRAVVLSIREEPYVEAAVALGARTPMLLARHVLPNTVAPLIVQATFVCASAILVEAILSFLGVGIPPETPTWGNIMAEGRALFRIFPHNILFPGVFLAATVLAVNMLGDGLRDMLDPRIRKRL